MKNKATVMILSSLASLMLMGAMIGIYMSRYYPHEPPQPVDGLLWPNPKQIGAFTLVDQTGEDFTLEDLKGHWSFLFFGYTHCPDVCPVTMSLMNGVHNQLNASTGASNNVQTVFVTVDPERDTIQRLREYMGFFNEDFIGLGGSIEQMQSLTSQIGIVYMYSPASDEGEYLVNHTSSLFLLDPDARLVSIISPPYTAEFILTRYKDISTFISNQNGR
jgi:protein SCO1/2